MTALSTVGRRLGALSPMQQDMLLAAVVTVGLLVESGVQVGRSSNAALTIVLVLVMGASLAWRRRAPALSTAAALVALGLYVRFGEVPDWSMPLLVIAIEFFSVGAANYSRRRTLATSVLLLGGLLVVMAIDPQDAGSSFPSLVANTAVFGLLPLAVGRALRNRRSLARQLRARTAQLERERDERMRQAGAEERARVARELHDVVAHSMSVMVIQAQAAERVAAVDARSAREALEAIERSGRDALHEMRGLIGVMRSSDAELEAGSLPGLDQLPALAERARAAGLPVELHVPAELPTLPLGLDLIAYRVVQEGLTNAIKHAGPAHATVGMRCTDDGMLELEVADDGRGTAVANTSGAGHGLVGMRERLALYGGELDAARRPEGGFRVRARIPLDAEMRLQEAANAPEQPAQPVARRRSWLPTGRRLDLVLAPCVAAMCAANLLLSSHRHGSVALNLLVAVLLGGVVLLRRSHPLLYTTATIGLAIGCTAALTDVRVFPLSIYLLIVPAYTLALYENVPRGLAGLAVLIAGVCSVNLVTTRATTAGDLIFPISVIVSTWAVGRALRGARLLGTELERGNRRLAREREHRARLAVADERTRIARELNVIVANSVSEMVVAAELAQRLLDHDLAAAKEAMSAIERVGREALVEMRRILGVLRGSEAAELEPQPGLGALPVLVEHARAQGRQVELTVEGEPGPLPASVELAAYRVVEEALAQNGAGGPDGALQIAFEFRERDLVVTVSESGTKVIPATVTMRERVALCNGELVEGPAADDGWEVRITLPTDYAAVFA
jgi:signal transduction histidine kinase